MAKVARGMAMVTKRAKARATRGMGMVTRVVGDNESGGKGS